MEQTKKPRRTKKAIAADYADRTGYNADFIKCKGFRITLDGLLKKRQADLTPLTEPIGKNKHYLHYHHFSVAMHKARRMPLLTAVNIDGQKWIEFGREGDKWKFDPRISEDLQVAHSVYKHNDLDLGHLVRRLDPVWGETAEAANFDTFHLTVCAPQHKNLNRKTWLRLEDYILRNTNIENLKVSVFTGSVFSEADIPYDGVLLPLQFWKIAAVIKSDGSPSVSGYLLSQEDLVNGMPKDRSIEDDGFGAYRTFQVPLTKIAEMTGINLEPFFKYDPLSKTGERGLGDEKMEINFEGDIQI
jgi:endonuclease G, mitochondrial